MWQVVLVIPTKTGRPRRTCRWWDLTVGIIVPSLFVALAVLTSTAELQLLWLIG